MRVLFTGGGTAGHINPALAAANYLKSKDPNTEILFVGNKGAMEEKLVPPAGYDIKTISISSFSRKMTPKGIAKNFSTLAKIVTASAAAKKIIKDFKPDVCVGTGGYVCGPVIREASKLKIPCVLHESNAYPGVTVKLLAKRLHTLMIALEDAKKYLPESVNIEVTGNPIRAELLAVSKKEARERLGLDNRPMILSFGGSLGSAVLNENMASVIKESVGSGKYQHIHSYGYSKYNKPMPKMLSEMGVVIDEKSNIKVLEYINNMADCMAAADLVISRSGAMSVSEIQALGKASILIPSPNVAENHQFHNAMALVNNGAAKIVEEKDLNPTVLIEKIDEVFSKDGEAQKIGKKAYEMFVPDVDERIYKVICKAGGLEI